MKALGAGFAISTALLVSGGTAHGADVTTPDHTSRGSYAVTNLPSLGGSSSAGNKSTTEAGWPVVPTCRVTGNGTRPCGGTARSPISVPSGDRTAPFSGR